MWWVSSAMEEPPTATQDRVPPHRGGGQITGGWDTGCQAGAVPTKAPEQAQGIMIFSSSEFAAPQ